MRVDLSGLADKYLPRWRVPSRKLTVATLPDPREQELTPLSDGAAMWLSADDWSAPVLATSADGFLISERPPQTRQLLFNCRLGTGEVAREIRVRSIVAHGDGERDLWFVGIAADRRTQKLAGIAASGRTDADHLRAAGELGTNTRLGTAANRGHAGRLGSAIGLAIAATIFAGAAYARYGVSSAVGSIQATDIRLVRATHQGTFFPYAPGNHLLKVGELVGVVSTPDGRSFGVAATCVCYLGDFPVGAGSTVFKGAVLARLFVPNSDTEVVLRLPAAENWSLSVGDPVRLEAKGVSVSGHVVAVASDRGTALAADNEVPADTASIVRIASDEAMAPALFGSQILVRQRWGAALLDRLTHFLAGSDAEAAPNPSTTNTPV